MLIDCPGCAKSYHISRAALGPQGRNVVCPHCLTEWVAVAGAHGVSDLDDETDDERQIERQGKTAIAPPEIVAEFISERTRQPSYEELYGTKPRTRSVIPAPPRRLHVPRTVAMIAATLGLVMAVIAFRGTIVRFWPQANAVYAAAGFPVNARGLDIQHVTVNLVHDGAQPLLVVDGEIANKHAEKAGVPELRLAVRDAQGHEIYTWGATSPKSKLDGGETIAFRARLAAPPTDGHDIFVRFDAAEPKPAR